MLILHTLYGTSNQLSSLFNEKEDRIIDLKSKPSELMTAITQCPKDEYILLLGYGNKNGLHLPSEEFTVELESMLIGPEQIELLRNHGNKLVGIWQDARKM